MGEGGGREGEKGWGMTCQPNTDKKFSPELRESMVKMVTAICATFLQEGLIT